MWLCLVVGLSATALVASIAYSYDGFRRIPDEPDPQHRRADEAWIVVLKRGVLLICGAVAGMSVLNRFNQFGDAFELAISALLGATLILRPSIRSRYDARSTWATILTATFIGSMALCDVVSDGGQDTEEVRSVMLTLVYTTGLLIYVESIYLFTSTREGDAAPRERG